MELSEIYLHMSISFCIFVCLYVCISMCWFNEFRYFQVQNQNQNQLSDWLVIIFVGILLFKYFLYMFLNFLTITLIVWNFAIFIHLGIREYFFFASVITTIIFRFILLLRLLFNSHTYTWSHYCLGILVLFMRT